MDVSGVWRERQRYPAITCLAQQRPDIPNTRSTSVSCLVDVASGVHESSMARVEQQPGCVVPRLSLDVRRDSVAKAGGSSRHPSHYSSGLPLRICTTSLTCAETKEGSLEPAHSPYL